MIITHQKQLKALHAAGKVVANCLKMMLDSCEPGMTSKELDKMGESFLKQHGAKSAPIEMYQFPGATCISINQCAAHGIPGDYVIKAGDVVNIDVSAVKDGFFADTGGTMQVTPIETEIKLLMKSCKRSLQRAMDQVKAGENLNVIGKAIEKEARKSGFSIIRNLCSHGIGFKLHEEPDHILGYYSSKEKRVLVENMVITIEPFLSNGTEIVENGTDGWALLNKTGCFSAQYEHTMVITKKKPIILTLPDS